MRSFIYSVIVLLFLILTTGCAPSTSENANTANVNKSVERMLAEIDSVYGKDDPVMSDDDLRVKRIRYLINSISRCLSCTLRRGAGDAGR
jgi:hypothetical protein